MATTEFLELTKPGLDASCNITVYDENFDKIDAAIKAAKEGRDALSARISAEETARTAAETRFEGLINDEAQERAQDISGIETQLSGKANSSHTHGAGNIDAGTFADTAVKAKSGTDYSTARVRNIYAGTSDLTAGSSSLASGNIYLVYE